MDKKQLLSKSLAAFMKIHLEGLNHLVRKFPKALVTIKLDQTPVTELDLALSQYIEEIFQEYFTKITFYSEEKYSEWKFPLLALDPLDGTQEYIAGRDEWAMSIGLFQNEKFEGEGWVYNPKTNELFNHDVKSSFQKKSVYRGEVSRSEWKNGLFKNKETDRFKLEAVGSIAYKLGRLSAGKCDYVVSLRPKNIWDIAGGTLLCKENGYKFYSQGKEVTTVSQFYEAPLLWCPEELSQELFQIYC